MREITGCCELTLMSAVAFALLGMLADAGRGEGRPGSSTRRPAMEDYATIEAECGGVPVYAFGYTLVYGVSPDLMPGAVLQEGNTSPALKIRPKKSWEIKHNLCGSTPAREPKIMWNDDQPLLPIHLIDGDPETAWSSRGSTVPDAQPEWIRIDLAAESEVASVALVCSEVGPLKGTGFGGGLKPGKALPGELKVMLSRDARQWETVYQNNNFSGPASGPAVIEFAPRRAKQIWIIGTNLKRVQAWGHSFSIGEVEVRDPAGNNLALVSRGAGVTVSSTFYGYGMDRFTQDMLWPIQYDLGFKWTRVGYDMGVFTWQYVEREKGKLEVDQRADAAITEAARNGVNVIMCLDKGNWLYHKPPRKVDWKKARRTEMMETYFDHPGWPFDCPQGRPTDSHEMMAGYLRYVDYMVRHFKGRVAYYEICNEWNGLGADKYLEIVKAAIPVIRKADPGARIMLGSIGSFDRNLILACLRAELDSKGGRRKKAVAEAIDAIGWHPFYQTHPDDPNYRRYRQDVAQFKNDCAALGFKGQYAATEWTWAAPYPGAAEWCSEMQKAKYSAQLMTAHCGMDVISLYNETFQTGRIDWDVTLLRNAFQGDPISAAQPQPIYYVLRTISTALDGFRSAEFPVRLKCDRELDFYTFRRGRNEFMVAAWISGATSDGLVEAKCDIVLPGVQAKTAWAADSMNGTEQELRITRRSDATALKGILIKDYPIFIRLTR